MATYYFKIGTGEPFSANAVTGDEAVSEGEAVKSTNAPDDEASVVLPAVPIEASNAY